MIYTIFYLCTITYAAYALFIPDCNKKLIKSTINISPKPSVLSSLSSLSSVISESKSLSFPKSTLSSTTTTLPEIQLTTLTVFLPVTTPITTSTLLSLPTTTSVPLENSLENDCLSMHNQARAIYNPSAQALTWDSSLAFRCANVAQYCATISQTHFDLGDNVTTPGLFVNAQNLFITKTSCSSSYDGWVTNEVTQNGGHYLNIINSDYSRVGCSVSYEGLTCICCDFTI